MDNGCQLVVLTIYMSGMSIKLSMIFITIFNYII